MNSRGSASQRKLSALVCAALLGATAACGGDASEQALRDASEQLAEVRADVEVARAAYQEQEVEFQAAERELERARAELERAEERLAAAEARVDQNATDVALFRTIQRRLLEDDALEAVAIEASVERGVVTLRGTVPNARVRDRALEIAGATPGVLDVDSAIELSVAAPPAP